MDGTIHGPQTGGPVAAHGPQIVGPVAAHGPPSTQQPIIIQLVTQQAQGTCKYMYM